MGIKFTQPHKKRIVKISKQEGSDTISKYEIAKNEAIQKVKKDVEEKAKKKKVTKEKK